MENMNLALIIYLIDVVCREGGVFIGFGFWLFISFVMFCLTVIVCGVAHEKGKKFDETFNLLYHKLKIPYILFTIVCIVGATLNTLTPSKQTAYTMLAAYGVESLANTPAVKERASKAFEVLDKAMADYLENAGEEVGDTKE